MLAKRHAATRRRRFARLPPPLVQVHSPPWPVRVSAVPEPLKHSRVSWRGAAVRGLLHGIQGGKTRHRVGLVVGKAHVASFAPRFFQDVAVPQRWLVHWRTAAPRGRVGKLATSSCRSTCTRISEKPSAISISHRIFYGTFHGTFRRAPLREADSIGIEFEFVAVREACAFADFFL